ncbi:phospholipid transport system substrate-binding protein [Paucimonas lemoignei]|uniref:Phospholipid transport system substrate-binding protein n=2 Tax=Paucimonas lemoignei TaxID=29443 RepID=A0A4R3HWI8_PAULE|nr:ABC transporter substrate-binding protein [Paucimonas lemoignei]TCS37522.1 phospholipid transport system substrate-binding protein [Paucimonas lemoignei]
MNMKKYYSWMAGMLFLAAMAVSAQLSAQDATQEPPDVLVKRVSQEIIDLATSDKDIQAGNRKRILEVVNQKILPHADFQRATALAVGRHWRTATPEQKTRLIKEFRDLLMYTYAGAMSQIKKGYPLEFLPLRAEPDATDVEVRFQVRRRERSAEPIRVSYRMAKTPEGWKIYDVNVLGVWMSEAYRNTFSSEIARGGIDGLIQALEQKNRQLAAIGGPAVVKEGPLVPSVGS